MNYCSFALLRSEIEETASSLYSAHTLPCLVVAGAALSYICQVKDVEKRLPEGNFTIYFCALKNKTGLLFKSNDPLQQQPSRVFTPDRK